MHFVLKYIKSCLVEKKFILNMSTVAEHVPFVDLCKLCQKISEKKGKNKEIPLRDFIKHWREFHNKLHSNDTNTTDSFYPAMRLLLPQCERERSAYGIKEVSLAKLFIEIFCLDKASTDAQKLLNYRSPKTAKSEAGDFASVAYFVLKNRCPEKGLLKISDINFYLDCISTNNAAKNKSEIKNNLLYLLRNTSALEQKWLIRMLLRDMKLGMNENSVLKVFHIDARDLYNVTNNLQKVCLQLKDPEKRLHEIEISLFTPFRPMLAEQCIPTEIEKLLNNKPFIIETKYDGERVQLHKKGNAFMYFSRGGHDYTSTYGNSPLEGTLTRYIANCFKDDVKNCILDGEIVIYSNKLKCMVSKGENAEVRANEPEGDYGICYFVFDILMLNDIILSNMPISERVTYIKNTFTPIENRIRYTEQKFASTNEEVIVELNKAIDSRLEGIVIKDPESIYKPNVRKHGGWYKLKPEYVEGLMDELDLLIVGGFFGEGRRANKISHFLLAVAISPATSGDKPTHFYSICKVGSGYSSKELYELSAKLGQHWQVYNSKKPPSFLKVAGGKKEQPDLWIEPKNSQILQIKAAEIIRSDKFATNYTLRFPRVEKIRYDKPWDQCMTLEELENLKQQAEGRLATKNYVEEEPSPKKIKRVQKGNTLTIAPQFRPTDVSDVNQVSHLLKDKEICVVLASPQKKQQLERQIVEHGGKFVQNPGQATYCILADKVTAKVKNLISARGYDVVKAEWLNSCIEENILLPWAPDDMLHTSKVTMEKLSEHFDCYGDSYTKDATKESLQKIFASIPKDVWISENMTNSKIAMLENKYFNNQLTYSLFRRCRVYINKSQNLNEILSTQIDNDLEFAKCQLKLYGADVMPNMNDEITHVLVHSKDSEKFKELYDLTNVSTTFKLVNEIWIDSCINEKKLLHEESFLLL